MATRLKKRTWTTSGMTNKCLAQSQYFMNMNKNAIIDRYTVRVGPDGMHCEVKVWFYG